MSYWRWAWDRSPVTVPTLQTRNWPSGTVEHLCWPDSSPQSLLLESVLLTTSPPKRIPDKFLREGSLERHLEGIPSSKKGPGLGDKPHRKDGKAGSLQWNSRFYCCPWDLVLFCFWTQEGWWFLVSGTGSHGQWDVSGFNSSPHLPLCAERPVAKRVTLPRPESPKDKPQGGGLPLLPAPGFRTPPCWTGSVNVSSTFAWRDIGAIHFCTRSLLPLTGVRGPVT